MWKFLKSKWTIGSIVVILLIAGYFFMKRGGAPTYQFIQVTRGSITQLVSITGNTTPIQSVSVGFQNTGTIAHIYKELGDTVTTGTVIAELNTANLTAALAQAKAGADAAQATLDGLLAGAQPADIAASEATLQIATQGLANLYSGISDAATTAYTSAVDAVRTQLNAFYTNAETSQPQLTYQTNNSQAATNAVTLRVAASNELVLWQTELLAISPTSTPSALVATLKSDIAHLAAVQSLLHTISATLDANTNLSATQLTTNRASVSAALTEVNTAMSSLNTISQSIASQQATVAQAQAQLTLKKAGSTPQAIAAQRALVDQAKAGVANAAANLQNAKIIAPIDGVITQMDAKVGQLASPTVTLVSIIGKGGFEVDAGVSETDIGKLEIGDMATMTLDAFPGETFPGTVFYIAPAQTNTQGVISYLTKLSFNTPDARLKSGLTANIDIQTKQDNGVLILPQYAILQNDSGTFVQTLENGVVKTNPVTLGIQDQSGNVEVLTGVTEGESVINIGLKK